MNISLVFLTLNEIIGLKKLFSKIPIEDIDEVFAVDGGSTDGTLEFFRDNDINTHVQKENKGRGEAFRIAFKKAKGDALIFFSPDGNEEPSDIPKFKHYLEKGFDIVIATRMVNNARNEEDNCIFKWRKWANNSFSLMANITWNKDKYITDTINGYRAITKDAWERITPDGLGYTIEYQSSIRAFKKRLKIAEFPTIEGNRIDNQGGSPSIKTGLAFLKLYCSELMIGKNW